MSIKTSQEAAVKTGTAARKSTRQRVGSYALWGVPIILVLSLIVTQLGGVPFGDEDKERLIATKQGTNWHSVVSLIPLAKTSDPLCEQARYSDPGLADKHYTSCWTDEGVPTTWQAIGAGDPNGHLAVAATHWRNPVKPKSSAIGQCEENLTDALYNRKVLKSGTNGDGRPIVFWGLLTVGGEIALDKETIICDAGLKTGPVALGTATAINAVQARQDQVWQTATPETFPNELKPHAGWKLRIVAADTWWTPSINPDQCLEVKVLDGTPLEHFEQKYSLVANRYERPHPRKSGWLAEAPADGVFWGYAFLAPSVARISLEYRYKSGHGGFCD